MQVFDDTQADSLARARRCAGARPDEMRALEFAIWLRDSGGALRHSKEGNKLDPPSNGELRRWIKGGVFLVNGRKLTLEDRVVFPITSLVLFPNNKTARCTLV